MISVLAIDVKYRFVLEGLHAKGGSRGGVIGVMTADHFSNLINEINKLLCHDKHIREQDA